MDIGSKNFIIPEITESYIKKARKKPGDEIKKEIECMYNNKGHRVSVIKPNLYSAGENITNYDNEYEEVNGIIIVTTMVTKLDMVENSTDVVDIKKVIHKYDKSGNKIYEEEIYPSIKDIYEYKYDNERNLIRKTHTNETIPIPLKAYSKASVTQIDTCIYDKDGQIGFRSYTVNGSLKNSTVFSRDRSSGNNTCKISEYTISDIVGGKPSLEMETVYHEYDDRDNIIKISYDGGELVNLYEYDENNNMIYSKENVGEFWYEYDDNGNVIRCKGSKGVERWFKYDSFNRMVYRKFTTNDPGGYDYNNHEEWWEYL